MKKISVFYGPYDDLVTGQQMAFSYLYDNFPKEKALLDCGAEGLSLHQKLVKNIKIFYKSWFLFLTSNVVVLYATLSRSRFGFYRDIICLMPILVFRKVRFINHLHGADFLKFRSRLCFVERCALDFFYKRIDKSIILSDGMADQYSCYPGMSIHAVSNFFTPHHKGNYINYNFKVSSPVNILFLSNIMESKGIFVLLECVARCLSAKVPIKVYIAGPVKKDSFSTAKQTAEKLKYYVDLYPGVVFWVGSVHGEEKENLFRHCDIFVFPTFYESEAQPIAVIEAYSYGCALVATDHNYMRDLVKPDNGILIDSPDPEKLASGIISLCQDYSKVERIKRYNFEYSKVQYSAEKYLESIFNIIVGD